MSSSLWELFDRTIELEGGFSDHPRDLGGPTAFGVTSWTWAKHIGVEAPPRPRRVEDLFKPEVREFIDRMRPIMARVTRGEAKALLFREYVERPKIDRLEPPEVAAHVADISVHSGPPRAIRMLQEVLVGAGAQVKVDGKIGSETINALATVVEVGGPELVNDALALERAKFLVSLSQGVFVRGWLRRAATWASSRRAKIDIMELMP